MPRRPSGRRATTHTTEALVLRRITTGEADVIVTMFTSDLGRLAAVARGARRSQKRFGGGLEPFHTLTVTVEEREGSELGRLAEATLSRPRMSLVTSLPRMETASRALSWVRKGTPERSPEPRVWGATVDLLDALETVADEAAKKRLAGFGLGLLDTFGWGLELEQCVRCGRPCALGRSATVDPARGGLVCRECGGGSVLLRGAERGRLLAAARGEADALESRDADRALSLVDAVLTAHAGFQPTGGDGARGRPRD